MSQVSLENTIMNMGSGFKVASNNSSNIGVKQSQEKFSKSLDKAKASNKSQTDNSSSKKEDTVVNKKDDASSDKIKAKSKLETSKKNTIQDAKGESSSMKVEDLGDEVVNDNSQKDEIDTKLLAMMSEVLQIPVDEIQSQLEEMGMTVQDLLSEEGFGKFVNQVLAKGDTNALLSGEVDVQKVSKLFDDLKELNKQLLSIQNKPVVEEKFSNLLDDEMPIEELTDNAQAEPVANQIEQIRVNIQSLENREGKPQEVASRYTVETEEEPQFSFVTNESSQGEELGMNVPIHNFTTTTFTQSFESEPGVVAQTTVTKQMVNGKSFIEQVDFKVLSQTKEINIALSPKELGNMNVKIVEEHGMMVAEIKVDNEKAKDFILNEIHELKNSLEEQGLNVADVKVDIRQDNHETQMQQERQKSSKRIQEILASFDEEEEEEVVEPLMTSDSEVDYMV